jgi:23S rRNA (pseudouridine1915-N3)-methyltransferase
MKLYMLAIGQKQPAWVNQGFQEYARRMPPNMTLQLVELKAETRSAAMPAKRMLDAEGRRLLAALPQQARRIVLDERGESWSTRDLAEHLGVWREDGRPTAFLIGGPDGIEPGIKREADHLFSLSRLTLPHGLARIVLAEQLYRATSLLAGHPYHRD